MQHLEPEARFQAIVDDLCAQHDAVEPGKMMSSSAVTYQGKVFAFFHKEMMTFKLGREFDPASVGVQAYSHLAPFKSKPPMLDWFSVAHSEQEKWSLLAGRALQRMIAERG